jgi:hypothetical protein
LKHARRAARMFALAARIALVARFDFATQERHARAVLTYA